MSASESLKLSELLVENRQRLVRMIQLRLDRRLAGRVDASDVIQDAYLEAVGRYEKFLEQPDVSPFVWLRFLTFQRLAQLHRHHLGVEARNVGREVSLEAGNPAFSSAALAARLVGRFSSPSNAAHRAELSQKIQVILNGLTETDREILALRHFEQLSNAETCEVLGIQPQTGYKRYARALQRVREALLAEEFQDE